MNRKRRSKFHLDGREWPLGTPEPIEFGVPRWLSWLICMVIGAALGVCVWYSI